MGGQLASLGATRPSQIQPGGLSNVDPRQIAIRTANAITHIKTASLRIAELSGVAPPDLASVRQLGGMNVVRMKELEVIGDWMEELSLAPGPRKRRAAKPEEAENDEQSSTQGLDTQDHEEEGNAAAPAAVDDSESATDPHPVPEKDSDAGAVLGPGEGDGGNGSAAPAGVNAAVSTARLPPPVIDEAAPRI